MPANDQRGRTQRTASRGQRTGTRKSQSSNGSSGQSSRASARSSAGSSSRARPSGSRSSGSSSRARPSGSSKRASAGQNGARNQSSSNGAREQSSHGTLTDIGISALSATIGVAGGVLLGRTALQRGRKILGVSVPNKVDFGDIGQQIGEAGRQFGKFASEVHAVRQKAEQIGRVLT